jgi:hypothetical protein
MATPDKLNELKTIFEKLTGRTVTDEEIEAFLQGNKGNQPITVQFAKYINNVNEAKHSQFGDRTNIEHNDQAIVYSQFQSLIEDKTKDFIGREYVFAEIEYFTANHGNGYFIIEGDPGIGKSTLIAEYVRRNKCIAHVNDLSNGNIRAEQFLESVCHQLISRYSLPYESLPPNATKNGVFFSQLLYQVKAVTQNEKLMIAIDALDEVDPNSYQAAASVNILYLPADLPEGVYFVMTRQRVKQKLKVHAPLTIFNLMEYTEQNLEDTRKYIEQEVTKKHEIRDVLLRPKLQEWSTQQNLSVPDFVNQLNNKSEGNFLYLFYVLHGIEDGLYTDYSFDKLPANLNKYYEDLCDRIGMFSGEKEYTKARIAYILSETTNPIPYVEIVTIIRYTGVSNAESLVNDVLEIWIRVLREECLYEEYCYSPYHPSYRKFLHDDKTVRRAGIKIKEIKKLMADSLDLYEDG